MRRSAIQRAVSGPSGRSRTSRFAHLTARGPAESSSPTTVSTAASRSSATSWTSPSRSAVAASNRSPVRKYRRAAPGPIFASANGEITAGMIPSFTSENAKTASARRDRDVGRGDEAGAAAERVPLDAGHHRCGAAVDRLEHRPQRVRVGDVLLVGELGGGAHPVDVGAGGEARPVAGEHNRAGAADVDERLGQLRDHRGVERVAPVRPRERDPQDRAVALDAQVGHDARA